MKYRFYKIKIKQVIDETPEVKTFILRKPKDYTYRPGQFFWITLPNLLNESSNEFEKVPMAIASGLNEKDLMFSLKTWGEFTKIIFELRKGDHLAISDAIGTYLPFDNFVSANIYLIAGGTGITPIRSVLNSLHNKKMKSRTILFYGVKSPKDFMYTDEFDSWNVKTIVENYSEADKWNGNVGYVTKLLTNEMDFKHGICFVCGPNPMMQNVVSILKSIGFTEDQLFVSIEKMINNQVIGPVFPVSDHNVPF